MAVKWIHVILVLIVVILFIVRQKCVTAAASTKRKLHLRSSFDDRNLTVIPSISNAYYLGPQCNWLHHVWPRLQKTAMPKLKYKRDPIIVIDNEDIGRHPRDRSTYVRRAYS